MKKTIAELMRQGMPLEDIHLMMEEAFNEAYKEREQEQKELEIAATRDRAAHALVDYMNMTMADVLDEPIDVEGAADLLDEAVEATRMKLDIMRAFGAEIKKMPAPMRDGRSGQMKISTDEDEALFNFLYDLGLVQPKK